MFSLAPAEIVAQEPQPSPPFSASETASQEAAMKAAERRKRFEEQKRKLEESDGGKPKGVGAEVGGDPDQTLFISPAVVNLLVGESHSFSAFELEGKTVTESAEWTLEKSESVELSNAAGPTITSKFPGRAILRAKLGSQTAEATITVLEGVTVPDGTTLWSAPKIPGFTPKEMVQAVPTPRGPDLYCIDQNEKGESLVRALTIDGRQMWMRKMAGSIVKAVPH
jgi:hypothetical protein